MTSLPLLTKVLTRLRSKVSVGGEAAVAGGDPLPPPCAYGKKVLRGRTGLSRLERNLPPGGGDPEAGPSAQLSRPVRRVAPVTLTTSSVGAPEGGGRYVHRRVTP